MKVICSWHKPEPIVIGEKCPTCGERAKVLALLDLAICLTTGCRTFVFGVGQGGHTHTACEDCRDGLLSGIKTPPAEIAAVQM